ncbi:PPE domain-containing protein [Mycolicibacter arupensis]|jgi:hypothetical protein|uniref:PPE domain-containing protein n=1 Tax=Mycolicibacter arupensis TaxID=342002 RepID=A0A5C7XR75_9MYCO|nr:PPE domain-containing protein [Mycolicibacter arupensis]TXI51861.1 MAG: PPE domain-containing protein [Mycolicibacter arupensis]
MSLYVEQAGLTSAAAGLAAAGTQLAALAATPVIHAPLAGDEVSSSAAARLSEHGQVLASRAADAAAVLRSAVAAVHAVRGSFEQMDQVNAAALTSLGSARAGSTPAFTPATPSDALAAEVPILPSAARDGEALATLMEQGQSQAGQGFVAACGTLGAGFRAAATAARAAQSSVTESLQGHTSKELSSALQRFAGWAESMATHSSAVAQVASSHAQRFQTAQQRTPTTQEFSDTKRKLAEAQRLNQRFGGAYSGAVTALQTQVVNLHKQAKVSAAGYHIGELPATPPPPPPVTPVVTGSAPQQPGSPAGQSQGSTAPTAGGRSSVAGGDAGTGTPADAGAEAGHAEAGLGPDGELLGTGDDPLAAVAGLGGEGMDGEAGGMAAALPSMLSGVLGGIVGAVTGIPAQVGQQVQSMASQAGQVVQGLASSLNEPELGDFDASASTPGLLGGPISGGSGGGGGGTEPAAGSTSLPAVGGGMLAAGGGGTGATVPMSGAAAAPPAAAGAGGGGMPMMPMMPMAGMGGAGGGTRAVKEPDKAIHLPGQANSELVKGEVQRRDKAVADDPTGEKRRTATAAPTVTTRRRIALPKDQDDE